MAGIVALLTSRQPDVLCEQQMAVDMTLDEDSREITDGFQCIRGNIQIQPTVSSPTGVWDFVYLRVQLEGIVRGEMSAMSTYPQEKVLYPRGNPFNPTSHLAQYLIKPTDPRERRVLKKSNYDFSFAIQLQGDPFPADYSGDYGRIQYKLVLYVGLKGQTIVEAAEEILKTGGYLNLALYPALNQKSVLTRRKRGFLFSSSSSKRNASTMEVRMILNRRGFLPGEKLNIILQVDNPSGYRIKKMGVTFVQRKVNCVVASKKYMASILNQKQVSCTTTDPKIQWETEIPIQEQLVPTFSGERKTLEILYFLQFAVETEDDDETGSNPSCCKGETSIVIGTERKERALKSRDFTGNFGSFGSMKKSLSDSWVTISVHSLDTGPPAYSSLSSRCTSEETLAPDYANIQE